MPLAAAVGCRYKLGVKDPGDGGQAGAGVVFGNDSDNDPGVDGDGAAEAAAGLDVLEGSVGRVSRTETPVGRWVTGLAGHFAELVFITGVALDQLRLGRTEAAVVLLVAVSLAQYGSLVRISARRVGKIEWQAGPSMNERVVRFLSILAYVTLSLIGVFTWFTPWLTVVAFGGLGLLQTIRIAVEVKQQPIESIMTVVKKKDGECSSFVEEATPFPRAGARPPAHVGSGF